MISKIVASAWWWSTGASRCDQLAEAVEQVLEPQHRADALVERVLVEDQGEGRSEAAGGATAVRSAAARIVS